MALSSILIIWILYSLGAEAGKSDFCRIECEVSFTAIGCYNDAEVPHRTLPNYILNERDPTISNYGGRKIDWSNWNDYMPGFACRCAKKANELGYDVFGVQFYGECWAGHTSQNNYASLGIADPDKCAGYYFRDCAADDRYCTGKLWTNMVYKVDTCSLEYERVGCFKDKHKTPRPLPSYLMNDRDPSINNFSGKKIDWTNWDVYVPDLVCRCAKKAQENGMTYFGLQFYGECWSGVDGQNTFAIDDESKDCIDQCYEPCQPFSKFCVGEKLANSVYKLKTNDCEIGFQPVGCFTELKENRALEEEIYNGKDPLSPAFDGNLISPDNWAGEFPSFLCKCARNAKAKGYTHFGVNDFGSCWSNDGAAGRYNMYGQSSKCYEVDVSGQIPCSPGSKGCSGVDEANYVFVI